MWHVECYIVCILMLVMLLINNAVKTFLFQYLDKKDQKSNLALKPFPAGSITETRLPYGGYEMIKTVALIQSRILQLFSSKALKEIHYFV